MRPQIEAVPNPTSVRVHLVLPRSFNDAQQIADKFKQGIPVILNLQSADTELSKRLIDFASGLTYALNGGMQRVADKVFLLTPRNVEVPPSSARSCSSAAASSTRRRRTPPKAPEGSAVVLDALTEVELLRERLRRRLHARDLGVHPDVLGPAAVLAPAGAAVPLRRLRAVPAPLAADHAVQPGRSTSRRWWPSSR